MRFTQISSSVRIIPGKIVTAADLRRIAALANRVPLHEGVVRHHDEQRDDDGRILQRKGYMLDLDYRGVDADIRDTGYSGDWSGKDNSRWVAAGLMKLVQDAGFKTCFWALGDGITAQALTDDGENIEVIAYCEAPTECLAAAGLAVWAERETRRVKG